MREDMYKVIVERPRSGRFASAKGRWDQVGPDESSACREALHKYRRTKYLNENLAPLRRFLQAQVGRPWDRVFAEICSGIDRRNTVQQHIHQHLDGFVAIDVCVIDGELCVRRGGWGAPEPLSRRWAPEMYVDPRTRLLRVNKARAEALKAAKRAAIAEQTKPHPERRDIDADTQLHRVGGVWYEVRLAPLPKATDESVYDVLLQRMVRQEKSRHHRRSAGGGSPFGRDDVYACSKRQLASRELRDHGLRNQ
jgi:hypothetical protein